MSYEPLYEELYDKLNKFREIGQSIELIHVINELHHILTFQVSNCPSLIKIQIEIDTVMELSPFLKYMVFDYPSIERDMFISHCLLFFLLNKELFIEFMRDVKNESDIVMKENIISKILRLSIKGVDIKTSKFVDPVIFMKIDNLIGKPTLEEAEDMIKKQLKESEDRRNERIEKERLKHLKKIPLPNSWNHSTPITTPITRKQNAGRKTKRRIKRKTKRKYIHIYK
jgi:hypothetical protein